MSMKSFYVLVFALLVLLSCAGKRSVSIKIKNETPEGVLLMSISDQKSWKSESFYFIASNFNGGAESFGFPVVLDVPTGIFELFS